MKDYERLYKISEFEEAWKKMFDTIYLFRALMISRCQADARREFVKKIYVFKKAFLEKKFDRINWKSRFRDLKPERIAVGGILIFIISYFIYFHEPWFADLQTEQQPNMAEQFIKLYRNHSLTLNSTLGDKSGEIFGMS